MEYSKFSFQLTPTDSNAQLGFEAWINDQCVFNTNSVNESSTITGYLPSDSQDAEHILKFVLKNKQLTDTQISSNGEIIKDACIEISNLTFDNIELGQIVNNLARYYHDFNGTQSQVEESFYGTMGCNGTVELKFTTPIYLWLLENM